MILSQHRGSSAPYPGRVTAPTPTDLSVEEVAGALAAQGYLADEGLATSIFLALALHRPLLLEGEAGVGKTEVAKVLSAWTGGELLRLQCYEGIDVSQAVYEWDYARQLLHLRAAEAGGGAAERTTCTANSSWSAGRCWRPSTTGRARRRSCSSTRWTAPTTSSRRSCSSSCRSTR